MKPFFLKHSVKIYLLTFISALLIVFSFPPWNFEGLIYGALVPWFFALDEATTLKRRFHLGVLLSFLMTLLGFSWVATVLHQYGNLPWVVSVFGLLAFGLFAQLQFHAFSVFWSFSRISNLTLKSWPSSLFLVLFVLVSSAFYTGVDYFMPKLFTDTFGHALFQNQWLRQNADWGGVWVLTFLIISLNLSVFIIFKAIGLKGKMKVALWPGLVSCLLGILFLFYGKDRYQRVPEPGPSTQFAVIQANIGDFDKIAAEQGVRGAAQKVLSQYYKLSGDALGLTPRPEVLIWPETSYPSVFRAGQSSVEDQRDQTLTSWVREQKTRLIFGGYDTKNNLDFNTLFFLSGMPTDYLMDLKAYHKSILLLFGEYIPGAQYWPWLKNAFPQVGNFGRGDGADVVELKVNEGLIKVAPSICYEILFSDYVIESVRKGANVIVNVTNDSWFGPWGEPHLHLALSVFRSIETRVPLIRATNTGISALINERGDIIEPTPLFEQKILPLKVSIRQIAPTLLVRWGDWFGKLCFALSLVIIIYIVLKNRRGNFQVD